MRIVAGRLRGRALVAPRGNETRPTADRVRQALFDMLAHAPWAPPGGLPAGIAVLDAFAGSGALGIESLSRGAAHATFLDTSRAAIEAIRVNLGPHGESAEIRCADACAPPPAPRAAGLVFLDPPYGRDLARRAATALGRAGWIEPDAFLVAETGADEPPALDAPLLAERRFGGTRIAIHRLASGHAGALHPAGRPRL